MSPDLTTAKIQITRLGMEVQEELTFDEWQAMAERLGNAMASAAFVIGDWLVYGEDHFRGQMRLPGFENEAISASRIAPDVYEAALRATGLDRTTLHGYAHVARRVPRAQRSPHLSWEHHKTVAKLEPEDQSRWLGLTAEHLEDGEPISTRRLRKSIQAGRLLAVDEIEVEASDRGIENHIPFVNRLSAWWARLKERRWLESASHEQRAALKRDLHPLVEIYQQL